MTMNDTGNSGGRIAYASKAAAQLLGLGIPSPSPNAQKFAPRSPHPQMNQPIALKFSSNKQPLFPNRMRNHTFSASSQPYHTPQPNPFPLRPHSGPQPMRPNSLPATPSAIHTVNRVSYPSSSYSSGMFRPPPQLQTAQHILRAQPSYNALSHPNHSNHPPPLVHPRSAHIVSSAPIKAMHNSNILQNIADNTQPQRPPQQSQNPNQNQQSNTLTMRRHNSASAAQHNHGGQMPRPHSYSPSKGHDQPQTALGSAAALALAAAPDMSHMDVDDAAPSNIRVVLRIRPLSEQERAQKSTYCVCQTPEQAPNSILVQNPRKNNKQKAFTFDKICHADTSQTAFFDHCGVRRLIESSLNGYATTLFAYGQTGSGKTFTVCGERATVLADHELSDHGPNSPKISALSGLIPRTISALWEQIEAQSASAKGRKQFVVRAGYLEVYNEKPRDLLNPHFRNLSVRWNSGSGFFVENQCIVRCESAADLVAVFAEGQLNREVGSHDLNTESSRSHCLFTIHIETTQFMGGAGNEAESVVQNGKISMVDLAGSEKLRHSKQLSDKGLRETAAINRSLFTLGKVIATLESVQSKKLPASTYIPYRDSVLTKLLMDSLGGSGMAIMVACVSPAHVYAEETLSTLYYASRARNIQNKPVKKVNAKDRIIAQLIQEVQRLKTENLQMKTYILQLPQTQNQTPTQSSQGQRPQRTGNATPMQMQPPMQPPTQPQTQQTPQAQTFPARHSPQPPLTQSRDRPFSWEQQNRNRTAMSASSSLNAQRFANAQPMQSAMQQRKGQVQGQGHEQVMHPQRAGQSMKPTLFHAHTTPVYASNTQRNSLGVHPPQQQARPPQSPAQQAAIVESLQMARNSAEQQATHAKQENFKLMDKIENLERVFMQN